MLVFQHELVQISITLHCLNLFYLQIFFWRCVIQVCTKHVVKASRPIITLYFPYRKDRKGKKLIIQRKYWNSRRSITVNIDPPLVLPYHFQFFKGCLSQILLGPFLNTLTICIYKKSINSSCHICFSALLRSILLVVFQCYFIKLYVPLLKIIWLFMNVLRYVIC